MENKNNELSEENITVVQLPKIETTADNDHNSSELIVKRDTELIDSSTPNVETEMDVKHENTPDSSSENEVVNAVNEPEEIRQVISEDNTLQSRDALVNEAKPDLNIPPQDALEYVDNSDNQQLHIEEEADGGRDIIAEPESIVTKPTPEIHNDQVVAIIETPIVDENKTVVINDDVVNDVQEVKEPIQLEAIPNSDDILITNAEIDADSISPVVTEITTPEDIKAVPEHKPQDKTERQARYVKQEEVIDEEWIKRLIFSDQTPEEIIQFMKDAVEEQHRYNISKNVSEAKVFFMEKVNLLTNAVKEEWDQKPDKPETDEFVDPYQELKDEMFAALKTFRNSRQSYIDNNNKLRDDNLKRKLELLESMRSLADNPHVANALADYRGINDEYRSLGPVPKEDQSRLRSSLQAIGNRFYDALKIEKELRNLDQQKNLQIKKDIIAKIERLAKMENMQEASVLYKEYQDEWANTGRVKYELLGDLMTKYREALQSYKDKVVEENKLYQKNREANLEAKLEIITRINQITEMVNENRTQLFKAGDQIKQLRDNYYKIGAVAYSNQDDLKLKFNTALDAFFKKRNEYYKEQKKEDSERFKNKEELIKQIESLSQAENPEQHREEVIHLQQEWKTLSFGKSNEEQWIRFRTTCDLFFEKLQNQNKERNSEESENLDNKKKVIDEINAITLAETLEAPVQNLITSLQKKFNSFGFVPRKYKDSIKKQFSEALNEMVAKHAPEALKISGVDAEPNMLTYQIGLQTMAAGDDRRIDQERQKQTRELRKLENEISTLENNMEFFKNSKNADVFKQSMEKQVNELNDKIKEIKAKLKLLSNLNG